LPGGFATDGNTISSELKERIKAEVANAASESIGKSSVGS
jgi:hypothetical protein